MCGIAGILQFETALDVDQLSKLGLAMAGSMAHRGPDDEGVWVDPDARCSLAHRRLSIIDPSPAGHQPMESADGRAVVCFNGEIYNYRELAPELEARGHGLRTRTDTEVLLEAVREWGPDAFVRLDGMYAFALYDRASRELWLARDPFGEKPLYYLRTPQALAFASELHALQRLPFFDDAVSDEAMAELLSFQYIGAPRTLYRSVAKLPPGHFMRVRADGRTVVQRYFEYRPGVGPPDERSVDDLADELEDILVRSIRRRMISDVPLGAFLSGGVDSSTVCALIRRKLDLPIKTFSIGFSDAQESEHHQARMYAEHIGTEHYDKLLTPDTTGFMLHAGERLDEPNGDSSCLPTYLLSGHARQYVTVAISGDGGDEIFGGYDRYFLALRKQQKALRRGRTLDIGDLYYGGLVLIFTDDEIRALFGRLPGELADHLRRLRGYVSDNRGVIDLLARMRKTDADHYLPGAVLPKVDRMSMRHSLEVRTPFLSIEMARFAERLPPETLYADGAGKLLLKRVASRYLPRDWIDLPKRGFGLPVAEGWGRQEILEAASSILEAPDSRLAQVIGSEPLRRFMQTQRDPASYHFYKLWVIGVLESYLRARPARPEPLASPPEIRRVEAEAPFPTALTALAELDSATAPLFLFCRDRVPSWWTRLSGPTTIVTPFAVAVPEGAKHVQADWHADRDAAFEPLTDNVPNGAVAVLAEPLGDSSVLHALCRRLAAVGFDLLVTTGPRNTALPVVRLQPFVDFSRWCRSGVLARGRRLGLWGRPIRNIDGNRYRSRFPLLMRGADGGSGHAVLERRRPLPFGDADLMDIRDFGGGRFRVSDGRVSLSSSNNSWPGRNRRSYHVVRLPEGSGRPWIAVDDVALDQSAHLGALERFVDSDNERSREKDAPAPGETIALITDTLGPGGAERQWAYLARELASRGFRAVLIVSDLQSANGHYLRLLDRSPVEIRDLANPEIRAGEELAATGLPHEAFRLAALAPDFLRSRLVRTLAILREINADYVACQLDPSNIAGGLAGLLGGARRVLLNFRSGNPTNFPHILLPWYRDYYGALVRSARIVLSGNSRFGINDYARWIGADPEGIRLVHNALVPATLNGTTPENARRLLRQLGVPQGANVVSGVFRLSDEKRPEMFFEVARRLVEARPSVHVLHAGGGPDLAAMRGRARQARLDDRIRFLGVREDVATLLGASDLLIMTSKIEGLSNTLLEAQYMQVPVVATAVGGNAEAVSDGVTGYLVADADADAVTRRCLELLDDPDTRDRMGTAGRERIITEFDLGSFADGMIAALSSAD